MAKSKYKEEKKLHDNLLNMLKKHFTEDEMEMMSEEDEDSDDSMNEFMGMKNDRMYDDEYEEEDNDDEEEESSDDFYEDMTEEEDEDDKKLPKDKRKDLAVLIVTKKSGRDKYKKM